MSKLKVVGTIAAALAVAYAGSTWWAGQRVEAAYADAFAQWPAPTPLLRVVERSYQRGFLGSVATVTFEIGCPAEPGASARPPAEPAETGEPDEQGKGDAATSAPRRSKPLRLAFRDTIRHGPLAGGSLAAATIDSELALGSDDQAATRKVFGDARPLTARSRVGFDGSFTSDIALAPGQLLEEGRTRIAWQGAQLRVRTNGERTTARYEILRPGLEAEDFRDGAVLKLGRLTGTADLDGRHGWLLATGKSAGRLEGLEFALQRKAAATSAVFPPLVLQAVELSGEAALRDGLYSSSGTVKGNGSIGATRIDGFELASGARRIQAEGYRRLAETWMQSAAASGCVADGKSTQAALRALVDQIAPDLKSMARQGPEVGVDRLLVEIDGRRAEFSYSAGIAGMTDEDLQLPGNALLQKRGVLKASARVPVAWIEKVANTVGGSGNGGRPPSPEMTALLVEQFEQQGYLKRVGDEVTSQVEFSDGQLKLIGKPVGMYAK